MPVLVDGGSSPRDVTCVAHVFTAHVRADPGLVWTALTGPGQSAAYLTWLLRPALGGCAVRLEVDQVENPDSAEDAEDVWLPVLAALQLLSESWLTAVAHPG